MYRRAFKRLLAASFGLMTALAALPAAANPAEIIGTGRLFTNDFLGDGRDRWQTGSYVVSRLRSDAPWTGQPRAFGEVLEYRYRTAIIASDGLGGAPDRPYAGILSFGVHSHFGAGSTRASLGFDVSAVGPQTGLSQFQERVHDRLGLAQVRFTDSQVADDVFLGVTAEAAEVVSVSPNLTLRPFGEVQVGPEDIIRVGADLFFGAPLTDEVLVRDVTSGHLYEGTNTRVDTGFSFVVGADIAAVADSAFLPDRGVGAASPTRTRLRAGVHWRNDRRTSVFYGLTYLSPEFEDQGGGQVLGSLQLKIHF